MGESVHTVQQPDFPMEKVKEEPELQKLHRVGWQPDPPPPLPPYTPKKNFSPKKEISDRKRKSHKKHKKSLWM